MAHRIKLAKNLLKLGTITKEKITSTGHDCTFRRGISSSRLCATTEPQQHNNIPPLRRPGLMIPGTTYGINSSSSPTRRFLPFPIDKVITQEHDVPQLTVPHDHLCRGSHEGWLVMVEKNMNIYLLNPFSETRIDLPPVTTLPKPRPEDRRMSKWYINKAILSASPLTTSDCTVMVMYGWNDLAFCKLGDKAWTPIEFPRKFGNEDAIYHKGKFHAVTLHGVVSVCDITSPIPKITPLVPHSKTSRYIRKWYLAESSKHELLQILRKVKISTNESEDEDEDEDEAVDDMDDELLNSHSHCYNLSDSDKEEDFDDEDDDEESDIDYDPFDEFDYDNNFRGVFTHYTYETIGFLLCKLDTTGSKPEWRKVEHLDGEALFLGLNQSFSVSQPHLLGYKGNRIYFTDDHIRGQKYYLRSGNDTGVFNLEDSSFEPLYFTESDSTKPPAIWITPPSV